MYKVKLTDHNEFIAEMARDSVYVERQIVRLTQELKPTRISVNILDISVVAGYIVQGHLVELRRYCGQVWQINERQDNEVYNKAKGIMQAIEATAEKLGLEVRPGYIELME